MRHFDLRLVENIVCAMHEAHDLCNEYTNAAKSQTLDAEAKQELLRRAADRLVSVCNNIHDLYHRAEVPSTAPCGRDLKCAASGGVCTVQRRRDLENEVYRHTKTVSLEQFTEDFLSGGRAYALTRELFAVNDPHYAACACY